MNETIRILANMCCLTCKCSFKESTSLTTLGLNEIEYTGKLFCIYENMLYYSKRYLVPEISKEVSPNYYCKNFTKK